MAFWCFARLVCCGSLIWLCDKRLEKAEARNPKSERNPNPISERQQEYPACYCLSYAFALLKTLSTRYPTGSIERDAELSFEPVRCLAVPSGFEFRA